MYVHNRRPLYKGIALEKQARMCGLWAYFLRHGHLFDATDYVRHEPWKHAAANRGPDRCVEVQGSDYHLCFHRLAIHDLTPEGDQPFYYEWADGTVVHLMCNGEIYNYEELVAAHNLAPKLQGKSDCEIIGHLLETHDLDKVASMLRGEFAFVLRMELPDGKVRIMASRDRFGVRPLYYGIGEKGIVFSSMLAGIVGLNPDMKGAHFPPGATYIEDGLYNCWSEICMPRLDSLYLDAPCEAYRVKEMYTRVTDALIDAVRVRLSSEREVAFLLSGGLDSSLVVAIATKILGVKSPRTFTIAFDKNGTDLAFARMVSDHLGTRHTELVIEPTDAVTMVPEVVRALETYDITTIRASTPQYILAKYIAESTDIRVILNGDGSDEVTCGYIYNYLAPSPEEAHADAVRLLREIHCFDGLRVDRTLAGHGLEARLPFLDPAFVEAYISLPPLVRAPCKDTKHMEKQFLRDAFATLYPNLLPSEVMYRQKEAFSDGVSSLEKSWYKHVQKEAKKLRKKDEGTWYKEVFNTYFPGHEDVLPHYWLPRWVQTEHVDPSARTLTIY